MNRAFTGGNIGGGGGSPITIDAFPTNGSGNAVSSGGVYTELQGKEDTLTFDTTPTALSTNPVESGGIKTYVDGKISTFTTVGSDLYLFYNL